ncbi:MAG: HAD-IA family hydrolase [Candidatus Nealsonbacteria bacterium]|nr:HAD-IA family hydrolase [Candidatus Nealsonbacteria bacterium]
MKLRAKNRDIQAIIFDMVGVLLFKKGGYAPKSRGEINAEKIEKLYNHLDDEKLLSDLKEKVGFTDKEISEALPYIPQKYEKFEELWELLPVLKKNYKLAVINNGNNLARKYWEERFDFSIFDAFIVSSEEKVKKPNPEIYLIVCRKLNVKPENCLFMDDTKENVVAAENLGMKAIFWKKTRKKKSFKKFIDFIQSQ